MTYKLTNEWQRLGSLNHIWKRHLIISLHLWEVCGRLPTRVTTDNSTCPACMCPSSHQEATYFLSWEPGWAWELAVTNRKQWEETDATFAPRPWEAFLVASFSPHLWSQLQCKEVGLTNWRERGKVKQARDTKSWETSKGRERPSHLNQHNRYSRPVSEVMLDPLAQVKLPSQHYREQRQAVSAGSSPNCRIM